MVRSESTDLALMLSGGGARAAYIVVNGVDLTGAALEMARRVLIDPDDDESRRTVRRFIATGGPHLRRALLDQIAPDEATQLMVLLGPPGAAEAQA